MGGRGASSGMADSGKPYGSEFHSVWEIGNIKFVKSNVGSAKAPMETMTKNRIYATVNGQNRVKSITFYDDSGKRVKQIDIIGKSHYINGEPVLPHTHAGYVHDENGTIRPTKQEEALIAFILKE